MTPNLKLNSTSKAAEGVLIKRNDAYPHQNGLSMTWRTSWLVAAGATAVVAVLGVLGVWPDASADSVSSVPSQAASAEVAPHVLPARTATIDGTGIRYRFGRIGPGGRR